MIRVSTIFIAICMVLIAASLGFVVHSVAGLNQSESAIVALAALTFLVLYNAVAMRLRERSAVGGPIADLSRGTTDLARQVAEFGRRLAAVEHRVASLDTASQERVQVALGEIGELGGLVRQLAISVAAHDDAIAGRLTPPAAPANDTSQHHQAHGGSPGAAAAVPLAAAPSVAPDVPAQSAPVQLAAARLAPAQVLAAVKAAIETNRIDLYLQPLVTLPQRKVRFYEAVSRIRDDRDQLIGAEEFIAAAEGAGLMGQIDRQVMLRCVQVLRRLIVRNNDIGVFCNMSGATLGDAASFAQCLDFLEANRVLAPSLVLEFKHAALRSLTPLQTENLAALAQRGYRFSIDHVTDLRIDARDLADRGVRFIKVPASLLLDQSRTSAADIHPADLSDLLGRYGIDLVAERIEGERTVLDLLDYDVRFGQGFLFAPPRPLRPEGTEARPSAARPDAAGPDLAKLDAAKAESVRPQTRPEAAAPASRAADPGRGDSIRVGKAALARRAGGPN